MQKRSAPSAPALSGDYQAEDDHRTLSRAAEITGDPARMRGVKRHHVKQAASLRTVGGLLKGRTLGRH